MSMDRCKKCSNLVDTDEDTDCYYTVEWPDDCICTWCRDDLKLTSQFDIIPGITCAY